MLEALRADLGLPEGAKLKAELHGMLVYAAGQFFKPHQDSEKSDEMIGTLGRRRQLETQAGGKEGIEAGPGVTSGDQPSNARDMSDCSERGIPKAPASLRQNAMAARTCSTTAAASGRSKP